MVAAAIDLAPSELRRVDRESNRDRETHPCRQSFDHPLGDPARRGERAVVSRSHGGAAGQPAASATTALRRAAAAGELFNATAPCEPSCDKRAVYRRAVRHGCSVAAGGVAAAETARPPPATPTQLPC